MESIVTISFPSILGIDIYSSKIIKNASLYISTLKESEISIPFIYKTGDKEIVDINTFSNLFVVDDSEEKVINFKELFGNELNSSDQFKLFDMLNSCYNDRYGFDIDNSPALQKYYELHRKILITKKALAETWKKLDSKSRTNIVQLGLESSLEDCIKLLIEPMSNELVIIQKLDLLMTQYKQILTSQSLSGSFVKEEKDDTKLSIKKNKYGQFVYEKVNFVYDPVTKCVVGVSNQLGGIIPLSNKDIDMCRKIGVKCKEIK